MMQQLFLLVKFQYLVILEFLDNFKTSYFSMNKIDPQNINTLQ